MDLPPGAEIRDGRLVHVIPKVSADGEPWEQVRPVSLDPKEAKRKRMDYYHPQLGWILEGYKLATDRRPQDIMADGSQAVAVPEEDRHEEKEED